MKKNRLIGMTNRDHKKSNIIQTISGKCQIDPLIQELTSCVPWSRNESHGKVRMQRCRTHQCSHEYSYSVLTCTRTFILSIYPSKLTQTGMKIDLESDR
ncbi:uncharacterized protein YALI1_D26030g [Yarrowia lipolytica]|uniref:Uncharacterized protein n=1 Tax=Yarrowia lipolytica TaxID=4952 RepID=A0A1D8NFF7_YARLL|nr:hypothetical protein YALI1_D26030g [Yarrowia lipolytica]